MAERNPRLWDSSSPHASLAPRLGFLSSWRRAGAQPRAARCGRCKAALGPINAPIDVPDSAIFDRVVREAPVPVPVDFWGAWCGPCRMVAPEVARAATTLAGHALVLKVDTERLPALAARYGVQGMPNFVVLDRGKVVQQRAGAMRHPALVQLVDGARAA